MLIIGMSGAANYMYEDTTIKGIGFKNTEIDVQTQINQNGNKLVAKESGSGNIVLDKTILEVNRPGTGVSEECCSDYINYSKESEFEYMPTSYQTGKYDQKWIDESCMQNYYIGSTITEVYKEAEHLQRNTEVKTRVDCGKENDACGTCTGALEANFNSNVIGVAHIGWLSKDINVNDKGRHNEYGRSVEDMVGVFSIEKMIQLWGNDSCSEVQVDWLPCV